MNDGLKILGWTFGVFFGVATVLCVWEKYHPIGLPTYFAHVEVHAHQDLAEAIREQAEREREKADPDRYEIEKEVERWEQEAKDTWGVTV